jgi:hypothetical protein
MPKRGATARAGAEYVAFGSPPSPWRKMPFSWLPVFGTSVPKALVVFTPRN